jgi:D-inositol-3-phosphate glycosyltransferase
MRIALPHPRAPHAALPLGADFASRRLIESLREYGDGLNIEVFSAELEHVGARSGALIRGTISPATYDLARKWDLLHDVRPTGDPRRHFHLRSAVRKCFPIVLTHHALNYPYYLDNVFLPLLLARSQPYDAIVCTSRAARDAVTKLFEICSEGMASLGATRPPGFEGQLPVIPLGVDTDLFRPRCVDDVRHQLGIPSSAFVLLWLGRLSPVTKADLLPLLHAFALLRERNPDQEILLVLVGADPEGYGRVLETYISTLGLASSVRLERTTPQMPVHLWYSAADVFVSPIDNVQESFGIAPVEAMSSGLPQVVSDWNGHRDTVVHGETGFRAHTYWTECDDDAIEQWVAWGDSRGAQSLLAQAVACDLDELVDYLERLLRSPELRRTMADASRRRAVAEFAWPVVVRRYTECWRELVSSARFHTPPAPPTGITPAFFRAFSGHASYVLNGASRLRIHKDAESGLQDAKSALPVEQTSRVETDLTATSHAMDGMEQVVSALAQTGGEATLEQVVASIAREDFSSSSVKRTVLRGIKIGLIQVLPSES